MHRLIGRFVMRLLPALLVAAAWLAWWMMPERPLRSVQTDIRGYLELCFRDFDGEWAVLAPTDNTSLSRETDFVLRFDPRTAALSKLPTPGRVHFIAWPRLTLCAWSANDGSVHVCALPNLEPVFTTPAVANCPEPFPSLFQNGKWLVISYGPDQPIDIWDVAHAKKTATLNADSGQFLNWSLLGDDQLRVVRRDKNKGVFRVSNFRLPEGAALQTVEVPFGSGRSAWCPTERPILYVYKNPGPGVLWDISTSSPSLYTGEDAFWNGQASPDGRYRIGVAAFSSIYWRLYDAESGRLIYESKPQAGQRLSESPLAQCFSPDSRYLLTHKRHFSSPLPAWSPQWLSQILRYFGFGDIRHTVALHDLATGRELRSVPASDVIQMTANADRFWTARQVQLGTPLILEEYPITAPRPPWWLWALTATGIGWYAFRSWRMRI